MTAEFPGVLRDLFKLSLEQAQRVFETFITTSEGTWRGTARVRTLGPAWVHSWTRSRR